MVRYGPLFAWLLACCCCLDLVHAQSFGTLPKGGVIEGEPVRIFASGLKPAELVFLRAERWYSSNPSGPSPPQRFRSQISVRADYGGAIDLDRMAPLTGSYAGVDPRGLFWSMSPSGEIAAPETRPDVGRVDLVLEREGPETLRASLSLLRANADIVLTPVDTLPGAMFARPHGAGRLPALILLGGSEGDASITDAAAPFASHGFAVLALPYFSPPEATGRQAFPALPAGMVEIPVEYLDRAFAWLTARPDVDASRIGIHGTSAGGTFALLAAVHLDWVDAVVASVPSDVVFDGWGPGIEEGTRSAFSLKGEPLAFVPQVGYEEEVARAERGLDVHVRKAYERGRAARPELAVLARIPAERIPGAVMLIGSYDDQMWPSGSMVQSLTERRIEAGLSVTAMIFMDAGHLLYDTGYAPTTMRNKGRRKVGGTPQADAMAQARIWPETLRFLNAALKPSE